MQVCARHVSYQISNERSRIGYMLDATKNDDVGLQEALTNIEDNNVPNGKHEDFEKTAAHIPSTDEVYCH